MTIFYLANLDLYQLFEDYYSNVDFDAKFILSLETFQQKREGLHENQCHARVERRKIRPFLTHLIHILILNVEDSNH